MKKLCITAIALILQVSVPTFALAGDELRRLTTEELAALTGTDPGADHRASKAFVPSSCPAIRPDRVCTPFG
jgi:hypothetical protein